MSAEEDSEPILGLWFEETIAPSDETSTNTNKETNNEASAERTTITTIVPDNREPHGVCFYSYFLKSIKNIYCDIRQYKYLL